MRTAPFEYHRAHDIDDALEWLTREEEREVKILAGGHSLLPLMKLKLATPGVLLDVQGVFALRGVSLEPGWVRIGALTRYVDLMRDRIVLESLPLLAQASGTVADLQVRNRGTIGGSLCHADPAAASLNVSSFGSCRFRISSTAWARYARFPIPVTATLRAADAGCGVAAPVIATPTTG